jgi:hypothetical protein
VHGPPSDRLLSMPLGIIPAEDLSSCAPPICEINSDLMLEPLSECPG